MSRKEVLLSLLAIYLSLSVADSSADSSTSMTKKSASEPSDPADYDPSGGAQYVTSHSSPTALPPSAHQYSAFPDADIKEWHFHVYFFQNNDRSVADAMRLKRELVENVREKRFLCVCDGVNDTILEGFDSEDVPGVNHGPRGPHPVGE